MLSVNLGTVKSRLVRGRACLRQLLLADDAHRISSANATLANGALLAQASQGEEA